MLASKKENHAHLRPRVSDISSKPRLFEQCRKMSPGTTLVEPSLRPQHMNDPPLSATICASGAAVGAAPGATLGELEGHDSPYRMTP
jgi:hypothetical protein